MYQFVLKNAFLDRKNTSNAYGFPFKLITWTCSEHTHAGRIVNGSSGLQGDHCASFIMIFFFRKSNVYESLHKGCAPVVKL
jgi:hypothetical protein